MNLMQRRLAALEREKTPAPDDELELSRLSSDDLLSIYKILDRWVEDEELTEAERVTERRIYGLIGLKPTPRPYDEAAAARLKDEYRRMKRSGWFTTTDTAHTYNNALNDNNIAFKGT